MINKSRNVAHTVRVYYETGVHLHAVLFWYVTVLLTHSSLELFLTDHFTNVFYDELPYEQIETFNYIVQVNCRETPLTKLLVSVGRIVADTS